MEPTQPSRRSGPRFKAAIADDLHIKQRLFVPAELIELTAVKASGPGGQHVNATHSAVQLRLDLKALPWPEGLIERVMAYKDGRITDGGIVFIKAKTHRSQHRNRDEALARLKDLLKSALIVESKRRPTRPTWSATKRRLKKKAERSAVKKARGRVRDWD